MTETNAVGWKQNHGITARVNHWVFQRFQRRSPLTNALKAQIQGGYWEANREKKKSPWLLHGTGQVAAQSEGHRCP
jgi:hypothetical protein